MSKIANYLQEHLLGEVNESQAVRQHLAYDGSPLQLVPTMAVYPRDEQDVRKTVRFCWQLAERGRLAPITARGSGSSTSGSAIGSGLILNFQAHMNRLLELDPKKRLLTVEPGMIFSTLEQTLYTHGLFLPAYPASQTYSTLGGGLATNTVGEQSAKYGNLARYVKSLRVVLSNGEVIETGPLSPRELNQKLGLSNMEGQIYRSVDALLEEEAERIAKLAADTSVAYNAVGYQLAKVKQSGSFDLTPLLLGSLGTIGIITEATLEVLPHNPETTLALLSLNKLDDLAQILPEINKLSPAVCFMLSHGALTQVGKLNPGQLGSSIEAKDAHVHLFIEFDEAKASARKRCIDTLSKLAKKVGGSMVVAESYDDQQTIRKVRDSLSTILMNPNGHRPAVPIVEDVCVPQDNLVEFISQVEAALKHSHLPTSWWGHAGSGIVSTYAQLDLAQVGDRQTYFKLSSQIPTLAASLGGSLSASAGDGRTKAYIAQQIYGEDYSKLVSKVKAIFDPHGILNPGVKSLSADELKNLLHNQPLLTHRHEHLPRA